MHGGEPTYMVAWPALVGGQVGGPGGRAGPAQGFGFPTMYFDQRYQVYQAYQAYQAYRGRIGRIGRIRTSSWI